MKRSDLKPGLMLYNARDGEWVLLINIQKTYCLGFKATTLTYMTRRGVERCTYDEYAIKQRIKYFNTFGNVFMTELSRQV